MNVQKSVIYFNPWESVIQNIYYIVKVHWGELKVETKKGEGSEFFILLPLTEKN